MRKKLLILLLFVFSVNILANEQDLKDDKIEIEGEIYTSLGYNFGIQGLNKISREAKPILKLVVPGFYNELVEVKENVVKINSESISSFNPIIDKYKLRKELPIDRQTSNDIKSALDIFSRNGNIEKTLLDARFNIKKLGIKFDTKVKSKSNRIEERFNYSDINSVLFKLNLDNLFGEFDFRYDLKANNSGIEGLERYLDKKDYDLSSPTEDNNLIIKGNLNILKKSNIIIKPKIYFNYEGIGFNTKKYEINPTLNISILDNDLNFEIGLIRYDDFTKNHNNLFEKNQILLEASRTAPGLDEYDYYKKYEQGVTRDIKNAIITKDTGVNRLDGLPSGTVYGTSVYDFSIDTVRNYFVENKYDGAEDLFNNFYNNKNILLTLPSIVKFANSASTRLPNELENMISYVGDKFREKMGLEYGNGYHKFNVLNLLPRELQKVMSGYEKVYLKNENAKYFDINNINIAIKELTDFLNENYPADDVDNFYDNNISTSSEENTNIDDYIIIDGKKYKYEKKFHYILGDATSYLINPLKKYLLIDDFLNFNNMGFFEKVGFLLKNSSKFINLPYKLLNENETMPEFDMIRGIFFYETEYENKRKELYDKLLKASNKDSKEKELIKIKEALQNTNNNRNNTVIDTDKDSYLYLLQSRNFVKSKYGANAKIKYTNDKNGIYFLAETIYKTPNYQKEIYSTGLKGGLKEAMDGKKYNFLKDNFYLEMVYDDNDELANGSKYYKKEQVKPLYYNYYTKHKRWEIVEEYKDEKYDTKIDFNFNKYGINISSNFDMLISDIKYKRLKNSYVYSYNQGVLHETFSKFKENITYDMIQDKTPIYKKVEGVETNYTIFDFTTHFNLSYLHNINEKWQLNYGLSWDSNYKYIRVKDIKIDDKDVYLEVLKRDKNGNPIDKKTKLSVDLSNETIYTLRDKFNTRNPIDGFEKESKKTENRLYEYTNYLVPTLDIYYKPLKNLVFKTKLQAPVVIKDRGFDGFMIGIESGIAIVW